MKLRLPLLLRTALLACLAAVPASLTAAENGVMHLYILTGQSNSLGSVKGSPATADQLAQYASEGLLWNGSMAQSGAYWHETNATGNDPTWVTVAPHLPVYNGNNCMGPEYGFSYMMLHKGWVNAEAGDGLGVIKASLDGGRNTLWVKGTASYNRILLTVETALDQMKESGNYSQIKLEGLMYLQGESDTTADAAVAQTRYLAFFNNIKADLEAAGYDSSLLVQSVLGEPATWNGSDNNGTAAQLEALADSREDIGWVRTRDLTKITSGDTMGVHYDGKSQITIGARYAYAMALQQGLDVGAVRNDDYTGVSLNEAGAWWNGAAPTAADVITWDVSSANVADTLSGNLAVKGIVVEDPFRGTVSIANASGGNATLSVGSSGMELQKGNLGIQTNLETTADQTWLVAGGHSLTVGSSSSLVTLGGGHTVSLQSSGTGTASFILHTTESSAVRTWNIGNGVDLFLSSSRDTLNIATGATVGLGAASGDTLALDSLTIGSGSTLNIGGTGTAGSLDVGSLTLGSGSTLGMDILTNSSYDTLAFDSLACEGDSVSFQFTYGRALTANRVYTLIEGWDENISFTYNADAGYDRTASLSVVEGNLVLVINGETEDYTADWVPVSGDVQTITANGDFNATANANSTLTVGSTASGSVYFYANNENGYSGDAYGELQDASVAWVVAYGSGSSTNTKAMTGTSHVKVSGTETVRIGGVFGATNATVNALDGVEGSGSVYVELANPNATYYSSNTSYYGAINGTYNSSIAGSVTLVLDSGTVTGDITAGSVNSAKQIGGGTYLQINGGSVSGNITGGNKAASTIDGGSHILINGGSFTGMITAGNNATGSVINGGARTVIYGGTFNNYIVGGGFSGTVNDGVELTIAGGDFSALNARAGIYAGGGSSGSVINGGTTITLLGIDDANTFASYTGILSGGSTTSARLSGTKKLVLDGYTAANLVHRLTSFDTVTATNGTDTRISNAIGLGGATSLTVEAESNLTLQADTEWDASSLTATIGEDSRLTKGGPAALTLASVAGTGEFRAQEGTAVLNSLAGFTGTVKVAEGATANAVAGSSGAVTYDVDKGGTARITAAGGNLGALTGSGLVELTGTGGDATTAFTMEEGVWTGTVKFSAGRTNMANLDMSHYGVKGSTIAFQGAGTSASGFSYLKSGSVIESDFLLEADANGIGLKLTAGSSDTDGTNTNLHVTFKGAWSGDGDFQFVTSAAYNIKQYFVFVNDLSGYEGDMIADCAATLKFGNGEIVGSAVGSVTGMGTISGTGSGADRTLNVIINYNDSTNSENSFAGNLRLTKEGASVHTLKAANSYTGVTAINGGTLALKEAGTLGSGNVSISTAADGLMLGSSVTLSAQGNGAGVISGHSSLTAAVVAGSESQRVSLDNLTITVQESIEAPVSIQYATLTGTAILAGQDSSLNLDHVSFDTASSVRLSAGATACHITATDATVALDEDEFTLSPATGENNVLTLTSSRFDALAFSGTLTLTGAGDYLSSLFEGSVDLRKIILDFEGADMSDVTDVDYGLPAGSPYTLDWSDGALILTHEIDGSKWTGSDGLWTGTEAPGNWNGGDRPSVSQSANLTGLGSASIVLDGDKVVKSLNVNAYDATQESGATAYDLSGDKLTAGSLRVAYGSLSLRNEVEVAADGSLEGWTGHSTVGAQGKLTVESGASFLTDSLTVNTSGQFANEGSAAILGKLSAGSITNNGSLSLGDTSVVDSITGTGSLTTSGAVSLGTLGNARLEVKEGSLTLQSAASPLESLTGAGSLLLSPAPDTAGSLTLTSHAALDIGGLSVSSLTLLGAGDLGSIGNLQTDTLSLSGVTLSSLESGTGVLSVGSLSSLAQGGKVTISLDSLDIGGLSLDTSYMLLGGGAYDASLFTVAAETQREARTLGRLLFFVADGEGNLMLVSSLLPGSIWYTEDDTTTSGAPITSDYTTLDDVVAVHIAGTTGSIDLSGSSLDDATDPTLGLTIQNLQGTDKEGVLTLSGTGDDLATLINYADTEAAGRLVADGLQVNVGTNGEGRYKLSLAAVELRNGATLHAGEDSNIAFSVGQLHGESGTVSGLIRITGTGGQYSGSYQNARLVLQGGAVQTLSPQEGLSLETEAGSAAILTEAAQGKTMDALHTAKGSAVELGTVGAGDTGLAITQGGVMGGSLHFSMSAGSLRTTAIAGRQLLYTAGSSITISQTEEVNPDGTVAMTVGTKALTDISLAQVGAAAGSVTEVYLDGPLFQKYYANARLAGNAVVVDRNTHYATDKVAPDSRNSRAGAALLDNSLLELNPQMQAGIYKDLAALLDAVDRGTLTSQDTAAVAGASVAALGSAFMGDMERQLRAIRNRTTTMGLGQEYGTLPCLNAWVNAEGDYRKMDQDGTAAGYTLSSWGGTVGCDLDLMPSLTAGLAITAMYGDLDSKAPDRAEGDFDSYYLSFFARYAASAWTHTFVASVGWADASLDRTVSYGGGQYKASGNTEGFGFGLLYELGYVVPLNEEATACLQPIFNVAWKHTSVNSYSEHGSDAALRAGDQTMDVVTFGLGARFQSALPENIYNRTAILEARALLKADAGDDRNHVDTGLLYGTNTAGIESAKAGALGVELGAGLTIPVGAESGALFLDGSVEWKEGYTSINGAVGYRFNF